MGGGWVIANCAILAWMGSKALRPGQRHASPRLLGLLTALIVSLAFMMGLILMWRPSLGGLSIGLSLPLGCFLFQLWQLKRALHSHAR